MTVHILYKIYGGRQYTRSYIVEVSLQIGRVDTTERASGVKILKYDLSNISELKT